MEKKERKERHKEDFKRVILEAAKRLFIKHGYEATSIRKIATEIGFSPTTIYLYYRDKSDIIYALHQEGFRLLKERFFALQHVDHPFERLKAMGRTYIRFALENKDFYRLMFVMKDPLEFLDRSCDQTQKWEEGIQVFDFLLGTIRQCQHIGYFKTFDIHSFALLVWSTVHGLCTLTVSGHLEHMAQSHHLFEFEEKTLDKVFENLVALLDKMK